MILHDYKLNILSCICFLFVACSHQHKDADKQQQDRNGEVVVSSSEALHQNEIIVCAHRGDWRNAPENSIQSIKLASRMGVDMVEIDVRTTNDGKLILMHDETIDRTTSGKGGVSELNYTDLQNLHLKNAIGTWTKHKIPTLEEALVFSKDNVDLNIDLKDQTQLQNVLQRVERLEMFDQILFKLNGDLSASKGYFGDYLNRIRFMPIVDLHHENALQIVQEYLNSNLKLKAFEILVNEETEVFFKAKDLIKSKGIKIWVNALWDNMCANHSDDRAIDDISIYQWYIDHNIDMVQTDRPQFLLNHLRQKKLHH